MLLGALILAVAYLVVTLWLAGGLSRKKNCAPSLPFTGHLSLLVAARNEENHLPALLAALAAQTFPVEQWDITIVDDRSTDGTVEVIKQWQEKLPHLHLLSLSQTDTTWAPKKYALQQALLASHGEIILVTDADCTMGPSWVATMAAHFSNPQVGLVQGITLYPPLRPSFLGIFQSVDFFSHSVVAAAGIGRSLPINSNANNFAYRRDIFVRLAGYGNLQGVISGDDDLFLQRVWEDKKSTILFASDPLTKVETQPVQSWRALFEQRKRWGSKTVYYKPLQKGVLGTIFLFYLCLFGALVGTLFGIVSLKITVLLFGVKLLGELFFLLPAVRLWQPPFSLWHAFWASPLQLLMVLYAVMMGTLGSFTWKGETFSRKRA